MDELEQQLYGEERPKTQPLPGFDKNLECPLCKVCKLKLREKEGGSTLQEFFDVVHDNFKTTEGQPTMQICERVVQNLQQFYKSHPRKLHVLKSVTKHHVHRHFQLNHEMRQARYTNEFMYHVLRSVTDKALEHLCDMTGELDQKHTGILLGIMDRVIKMKAIEK